MLHLVIGTSSQHKVAELRDMLGDIEGVAVQAFSDLMPIPEVDEDGSTFAQNASTKAHLFAQYLFASRGASASGRHTSVGHDTMSLDKLSAARAREQRHAAANPSQSSRRFAVGNKEPMIRSSDVLVLADDSGIVVDALGGRPGIHSARYSGVHGDDDANNRKLLKELGELDEAPRTARFVCAIALANQREVLFTVEGKVEGLISTKPIGDRGFGYDPLFFYPPYRKTFGEIDAAKKNAVSHRANAIAAFKKRLVEAMQLSGLAG